MQATEVVMGPGDVVRFSDGIEGVVIGIEGDGLIIDTIIGRCFWSPSVTGLYPCLEVIGRRTNAGFIGRWVLGR